MMAQGVTGRAYSTAVEELTDAELAAVLDTGHRGSRRALVAQTTQEMGEGAACSCHEAMAEGPGCCPQPENGDGLDIGRARIVRGVHERPCWATPCGRCPGFLVPAHTSRVTQAVDLVWKIMAAPKEMISVLA